MDESFRLMHFDFKLHQLSYSSWDICVSFKNAPGKQRAVEHGWVVQWQIKSTNTVYICSVVWPLGTTSCGAIMSASG